MHPYTSKSACRPSAVTSRRALRETLLGLQQPMQHHQLAHQVVQGLAGGLPVRIGDRPDQQRKAPNPTALATYMAVDRAAALADAVRDSIYI